MNNYFEIDEKNVENVLSSAKRIALASKGKKGERSLPALLLNEIAPYCDFSRRQVFEARPQSAAFCRKTAFMLMLFAAVLFKLSVIRGSAPLSCVALFCSISAFCLFTYKFVFGGRLVDKLFSPTHAENLFFVRKARSTPILRVVLSSCGDEKPQSHVPFFGQRAPSFFLSSSLCANTLIFSFLCFYLLTGASLSSRFFDYASSFSCLLGIVNMPVLFLYKNKGSRVSQKGLLPTLCIAEIMKELSFESVRFPNTELCVLVTGADFPCHEGAREFIRAKKSALNDVPTLFICVDEITAAKRKTVSFGRKKSGEKVADSIIAAAEGYNIDIIREASVFGTPPHAPFENSGFAACSLGSSKASQKSASSQEEALLDILNIIKDTVRNYGNER